MALELIGKLIQVNQEISGKSARGDWKKREMIIETIEQFPKKVCIGCFGDKADQVANYQPGTELRIAFNLESREFNSKYYTDVKAWKIDISSGGGSNNSNSNSNNNNSYNQSAPSYSNQSAPAEMPAASQGNDDLPF